VAWVVVGRGEWVARVRLAWVVLVVPWQGVVLLQPKQTLTPQM